MTTQLQPWYVRSLPRWRIFRSVPMTRLSMLLIAGFLLLSISGFYSDLMAKGTKPYAVVFVMAAYSGLNACLWVLVIARLPTGFILPLIALEFLGDNLLPHLTNWMVLRFALKPVPSEAGIYFSGTAMLWASILSYVFFLRYIVREGKQSLRLQNELELAHGIQKTLVPVLQLRTAQFEIYGVSHPSERVGGDLVDAVALPDGGTFAYLADITGHGLGASILMGRLKTAVRTALLEAGTHAPDRALPLLLDRLNIVLPQVKEANLYATFTGFRFGRDGSVFYAMAASPPICQWHARRQLLSHVQEPQLPLGLLPVAAFEGSSLNVTPGDLLVVATDGILETSDQAEEEFGLDRLKAVIASSPEAALPKLADAILAAARAFGHQHDDQTLLLIRCLAALPEREESPSLPARAREVTVHTGSA